MKRPNIFSFLAVALLSEGVYLTVFTRPFPLARWYATIPPVDYAKLTGHSAWWTAAFVVGTLVLFGLYGAAMALPPPPLAPYSGLVFAATLFFSYPTLAIDLFIYAIRTRGWALYGLNPLATAPLSFPPTDPWLGLAAEWVDAPSPYGPLWEVLSLGAFRVTGGDFLLHLFALKAMAVLAYLACIALIGAILGQLRPAWRTTGMLAFAWNPLVLLETAQNAHNDIVMVALLLAAVWALVRERDGAAMVLLAMSVLVKFVTALAAPFFLLYIAWKRPTLSHRLAALAGYGVLFAAPVIAGMLPLWPGWDAWAVLKANSGAGRSLLALLVLALRDRLGTGPAFDVSRLLLNGGWVGATLWALWHRRKRLASVETLLFRSWALFFSYVLLAAPVFHAWYLLWFLPLAILLPEPVPLRASLVFCFTALLVIPYFETVRIWIPALLQNHLLGHAIGVPLLVIPPAWAALQHTQYVVRSA